MKWMWSQKHRRVQPAISLWIFTSLWCSCATTTKLPVPQTETYRVRLYSARALGWHGFFAIHTWLAYQEPGKEFISLHKMAFVPGTGKPGIYQRQGLPTYFWTDGEVTRHWEITGELAETATGRIKKAVEQYAFQDFYLAWPGPNSNTFTAYLLGKFDHPSIELPSHAIGKNFATWDIFRLTPTGYGVEFSLFGLLGLTIGPFEGLEANLLGLNFGIDFWTPALKLPIVGRIGFPDHPAGK